MKQLFQNMKTGSTDLIECPYPQCKRTMVVIQSRASLISLGTERMLVEFGKSNIIQKARQQPERVMQVLDKVKTEGVVQTFGSVMEKLDEPLPLGYSNAGVVLEAGSDVLNFKPGDRVISNGPHAEIVMVPENLVAKIPDNVSFENASFTVVGAIGLQGIRLANPTLGENMVIIGLGLIGLLTAQLAMAHGCKVIAFDIDQKKVDIAVSLGIEAYSSSAPVEKVVACTGGYGTDSVLITASSPSEQIIGQAAGMCRKRGKIILIGVIPLPIKRADFYEKELTFQVSCSYGPGRYDPEYEMEGHDYPLPYVRWTEKRNFETVLHCLSNNKIMTDALITNMVSIDKTPELYAQIGDHGAIATIITYHENTYGSNDKTIRVGEVPLPAMAMGGRGAIIGTGNFTKMAMLPAFKKLGIPIKYLCSQSGANGAYLAKKYSIPFSTTELNRVLSDDDITNVFVATRHRSHSDLAIEALSKGKHVFVEKPLAVDREQLSLIVEMYSRNRSSLPSLTVGFNRRYSPLSLHVAEYLRKKGLPINMVFTMNAGMIPATHWTQSREERGRVIGEACHCIDLFVYFAGSQIVEVCASSLGNDNDALSDNVSILLKSENGSNAVVNYFANGSKKYRKEQVLVFSGDTVLEIDNFKKMRSYGGNGTNISLLSPDKGHAKQFEEYNKFILGKGVLRNSIPEHFNVTEAAIASLESIEQKKWVAVATYQM